jgi:transcriptional regulator with XRE-family HTH domain
MCYKERATCEIDIHQATTESDATLKTIGRNIKNLRITHNLTQNDLAFYCYLDVSVISKLERGDCKNVTLFTLQKMAVLFHTTISTFFI